MSVLAVLAGLVGLFALAGMIAAVVFFIGLMSYGWLSQIAPEAELAALLPARRRGVTVRALIGLALLWVLLLGDRTSSRNTRHRMDGNETFAFSYRLLRRFAGLPATPSVPAL